MRFMQDVIDDNDLTEEADDFFIEDTGNNGFCLGIDSDLDESSDEQEEKLATVQKGSSHVLFSEITAGHKMK